METVTYPITQKKRRERLFLTLDDILSLAEQKRKIPNATDKLKQAWCRIAISAVEAYGSLLKDCELEEIEERLDVLEQSRKEKSW